ncbi:MAG: RNA polymerase factor sigma-32 [Pseudomonadota bacterium]
MGRAHIDDKSTQRANLGYIRNAMKTPMLSREEEQLLARQWRDNRDERSLHKLINAYGRLVIAMASKFKNYGLPMGDLIQEGNLGLMHASSRFEPERDIRFSTYASWWIRSTMQDYVLRNWSIVRTGTTAAQKSLFFNFRRLRARIEGEGGNKHLSEAARASISTELNVPLKDVEEMENRLRANDQSLNATISIDGEDEYQDFLVDTRPNPEDIVIGIRDSQSRSKWLAEALATLPDRERIIISERHLQEDGVTLEQIGKELGISKERVRQLEQRAMEKLHNSLAARARNVSDFFPTDSTRYQ